MQVSFRLDSRCSELGIKKAYLEQCGNYKFECPICIDVHVAAPSDENVGEWSIPSVLEGLACENGLIKFVKTTRFSGNNIGIEVTIYDIEGVELPSFSLFSGGNNGI